MIRASEPRDGEDRTRIDYPGARLDAVRVAAGVARPEPDGAARRDPGDHRRERLRQDGPAQADYRPATAHGGADHVRWTGPCRSAGSGADATALAVRVPLPGGGALRQSDGF